MVAPPMSAAATRCRKSHLAEVFALLRGDDHARDVLEPKARSSCAPFVSAYVASPDSHLEGIDALAGVRYDGVVIDDDEGGLLDVCLLRRADRKPLSRSLRNAAAD